MKRFSLLLGVIFCYGLMGSVGLIHAGVEGNEMGILYALRSGSKPLVETNGYIYVTVSYEMGESDSIAGAKEKAIAKARKMVMNFKGMKISHFQDFFSVVEQNTSKELSYQSSRGSSLGIITEYKNYDEYCKRETLGNMDVYRLICRMKYVPVKGAKDPEYLLSVKPNKVSFVEGQKVTIKIGTQIDGYITVLSIDRIGKIYKVYPNEWTEDTKIEGGVILELPTKEDKQNGVDYTTALVTKGVRSIEIMKIIVTERPLFLNNIETYDELMGLIVRLKRDQFEYVDIGYIIEPK